MLTATNSSNNDKLQELVLYLCKKGANDSRLGRTKLNKLLYYADFGFFLKHGRSITNAEYMAIENGPVPRQMKPTIEKLANDGRLKDEHIPTGMAMPLFKPVATVDPNLSIFTAEEIAFVDEIVQRFWQLTGTDLSNMSHSEPGYKAASYRETIPYATAYYPAFMEPTEDEKVMTLTLAKDYKWHERFAA
jgi:uncharacterized phage-associated protein